MHDSLTVTEFVIPFEREVGFLIHLGVTGGDVPRSFDPFPPSSAFCRCDHRCQRLNQCSLLCRRHKLAIRLYSSPSNGKPGMPEGYCCCCAKRQKDEIECNIVFRCVCARMPALRNNANRPAAHQSSVNHVVCLVPGRATVRTFRYF